MNNVNKKTIALAIKIVVFGAALFLSSSFAKAADTSCNPACVLPEVCSAGACILPSHSLAPNAPIAASSIPAPQRVPGTTEGTGIVSCGRAGQDMCTLCDLIRGMNIIINYLMKLAIGVALLAMAIGGVMYIVSAGDTGQAGKAKSAITNAAIGFVIIFSAFLIINTTINYIGSIKDASGQSTFGMNITSWGNFDCTARVR
jgi:hypothetical protein